MSNNDNSNNLFPRRQSGWKCTINTGQYLALYENDIETDPRRIANLIADELEKANQNPLFVLIDASEDLTGIIEDFRLVTDDVEELDDCLAEMYNWGDFYRVWFTPVFEAKVQARDNDSDYDWRVDNNVYPFDTIVVWPTPGAGGGGTGGEPSDERDGAAALLPAVAQYEHMTYIELLKARELLDALPEHDPRWHQHYPILEAATKLRRAEGQVTAYRNELDKLLDEYFAPIQPRIARYAVDQRYLDATPGSTQLLAGFDTENEAIKFALEMTIDSSKFYLAVYDREQKRDVFSVGDGYMAGDDPAAVARANDAPPPAAAPAKGGTGLTKAQRAALNVVDKAYLSIKTELQQNGKYTYGRVTASTAKTLMRKGLAERVDGVHVRITDAGRKRFAEGR